VKHLWKAAQEKKSELFRKNIERLIVKLSDILKSDYEKSEKGRSAEHLENSIGEAHGIYLILQSCQSFFLRPFQKKDFLRAEKSESVNC
jgi:molybdopterin-biosynthesis enzyme MoeA-like protein